MAINEKLTQLKNTKADIKTSLSNLTEMNNVAFTDYSTKIDGVNTEVATQTNLLAQAVAALDGKAAGGSGSGSVQYGIVYDEFDSNGNLLSATVYNALHRLAFYDCKTLKTVNVVGNITNIHYAFANCFNLTAAFCSDNVVDMSFTYRQCLNLTTPVCGKNVVNMSSAYYSCPNLTTAVCGDNVINMYHAYYKCDNIKTPVCGKNVVDMGYAYSSCINLTTSVCGDNVENMYCAYSSCNNLTTAVCGNGVTNMSKAYSSCANLMTPACGKNVVDMSSAYSGCKNLTTAVCGDNVVNMSFAYSNCTKLTTAVFGNNVTTINSAYRNCTNIQKNCYIYSQQVSGAGYCFANKSNSYMLNIYVPSGSTTQSVMLYKNTLSLAGANITWTNDTANNRHYNTTYNIYIYPVANVAAAREANGD